jgi:integrase/recombinase XerD
MKADDLLLHLEAYIALESALGFSLRARERLLRNFVAFVQGSGTMGPITAQIALDWACLASDHCGTSGKAARLSIARRFLFHLSAVVPGTEIPNATLLVRPRRQKPFLFSAEEISRLLKPPCHWDRKPRYDLTRLRRCWGYWQVQGFELAKP